MDIIEKKILQWCGQVKMMPEERIPKLIMERTPPERRKRGRPRKTWIEGVQAAMGKGIWNQIKGETEKNGVRFPEDGDSCYETV